MQIHELTNPKLNEGLGSAIGSAAGAAVSGLGKVGSAIASPFKDIKTGYQIERDPAIIAKLSDKMYRGWQQYAVRWAQSQGGQYTQPGKGAGKQAQGSAGTGAGAGVAGAGATAAKTGGRQGVDLQALYTAVQRLDNKQLAAVGKILGQRVGPAATMAALKKPEPGAQTSPGQLNELDWQGIKSGAQRAYQAVKPTVSAMGQLAKAGIQQAPALAKQVGKEYSKAATKVGQAVKAAPGALATGAGATAGALAGMPGRARTAFRTGKEYVSGPTMTTGELNLALSRLTPAQAQKLLAFVQQIQTGRKAGLREGISPASLLPGYEQALKAFIQKNLFGGMQYSRIQNVQQIDQLVKQIADPVNDTADKQKKLWNDLTLAASVAQYNPAPGAEADSDAKQGGAGAGGAKARATGVDDPAILRPQVEQAVEQLTPAGTRSALGKTLRQAFTQNNATLKSTGEPGIDAFLMSLNFNIQ